MSLSSSSPLPSSLAVFSQQIFVVDHYMTAPVEGSDNLVAPLNKARLINVPVVRIFGSTAAGQVSCLHIHKIYPYFYIPYLGPSNPEEVDAYIKTLFASTNQAAFLSLGGEGKTRIKQFLYHIELVSAKQFYGFHPVDRQFLKIYVLNPAYFRRVGKLLHNGAVMGTKFQPHEIHVPFNLQVFMDYNLFGMDFIHLSQVKFRLPLPESEDGKISAATLPKELMWPVEHPLAKKTSYCELEADCSALDILNRLDSASRRAQAGPNKIVSSLAGIWEDELRRRQAKNPEAQISQKFSQDRVLPSQDEANDRWKKQIQELIQPHLELRAEAQNIPGTDLGEEEPEGVDEEAMLELDSTFEDCLQASFYHQSPKPSTTSIQARAEPFLDEEAITLTQRQLDGEAGSAFPPIFETGVGVGVGAAQDEEEEDCGDMEHFLDGIESQIFEANIDTQDELLAATSAPDAEEDPADALMPDIEDLLLRKQNQGQTRHPDIPQYDGGVDDFDLPAKNPLPTKKRSTPKKKLRDYSELHFEGSAELLRMQKDAFDSTSKSGFAFLSGSDRPLVPLAAPPQPENPTHQRFPKPLVPPPNRKLDFSALTVSAWSESDSEGDGEPLHSRRSFQRMWSPSLPDPSEPSISRPSFYLDPPRPTSPSDHLQRPPPFPLIVPPPPRPKNERPPDLGPSSKGGPAANNNNHGEFPSRVDDWNLSPISSVLEYVPETATERRVPFFKKTKRRRTATSDTLLVEHTPETALPLKEAEPRLGARLGEKTRTVSFSSFDSPPSSPGHDRPAERSFQLDSKGRAALDDSVSVASSSLRQDSSLGDKSLPQAADKRNDPMEAPPREGDFDLSSPPKLTPIGSEDDEFVPETLSRKRKAPSEQDPEENPPPVAFRYHKAPPTPAQLLASIKRFNIPTVEYEQPFYSDPKDVPSRPLNFGGNEVTFKSKESKHLPRFAPAGSHVSPFFLPGEGISSVVPKEKLLVNAFCPVTLPPPKEKVLLWLDSFLSAKGGSKDLMPRTGLAEAGLQNNLFPKTEDPSQVVPPTPKNPHGFKVTPSSNESAKRVLFVKQPLRYLSLEVHANSRQSLHPNPAEDAVQAIMMVLKDDRTSAQETPYRSFVLSWGDPSNRNHVRDAEFIHAANEEELLLAFIGKVRELDPDMLIGFETQKASLGYLMERSQIALSLNLCQELSRIQTPGGKDGPATSENNEGWEFRHSSGILVTGRNVLNVWRILKSDIALNVYSFQNFVFHILHQRVPHYPPETLTDFYVNPSHNQRWRVLDHYLDRARKSLDMLDRLEVIDHSSEFARVIGTDFYSILTRGSQYKVESVMLRVSKANNYIALSPGPEQVAKMNAPECLQLIMEPESRLYNNPVVVLDFQSLYPSIMIAYNYCFSTCLGRVGVGQKKFGASILDVPANLLDTLMPKLTISPNGVMFVTKDVREGVMPKMLQEILETRVMVKNSLKKNAADKRLARILESRQMGLKYIANVTYGYTGANFSGRMPCVEVADSIVQTARKTLEAAIHLIENTKEWNAHVVYGDTDSVFVSLPGVTREEAFRIGQEIAERVTAMNPKPVKLRFEKVYQPCVLMTKKRYFGFKYESPHQKEPTFDAKGIETVRRDTCPAVSKTMETSIKILFRTNDLSQVKKYLQNEWVKILQGRVTLQDFIFAKEVRLGTYSEKGTLPPSAQVGTKQMKKDPRCEPLYRERIRYVVVYGEPNSRLRDQVISPEEFLAKPSVRLHGHYYITKQIIPALSRFLNLVGADLHSWFAEIPRTHRVSRPLGSPGYPGRNMTKSVIEHYYRSTHCYLCNEPSRKEICPACLKSSAESSLILYRKLRKLEKKQQVLHSVCSSCCRTSGGTPVSCKSLDCQLYFKRVKISKDLTSHARFLDLLEDGPRGSP